METKLSVLVRDFVSIAVGAFGLIHSQLTGMMSTELLIIYTGLLGYPGMLQLLELKKKDKDKDGADGQSSDSHSSG